MSKVVAIHQPNFFPWLGFFDKIHRADVFILFDDVQFPKTGGVWSNRAMFLVSGEARWITATIDRNYHGTKNINEMNFHATDSWRNKMFKSLENNYNKHPYYDEVITEIFPLLNNKENNIALYNVHAILRIAKIIEIDLNNIKLSSKLEKSGKSNELLINLTKSVNGDTYMCGGGADGYQEAEVFKSNDVKLEFQNFQHPTYPQFKRSSFTAGLSIIDALMNIGFSGTAELIRK